MGIGTDIGGSIRMPAFYCGIFGHKPTTGTISLKGLTLRTGEEGHTMACVGPMSRHAEDLLPFLKVLLGDNRAVMPNIDHKVQTTHGHGSIVFHQYCVVCNVKFFLSLATRLVL